MNARLPIALAFLVILVSIAVFVLASRRPVPLPPEPAVVADPAPPIGQAPEEGGSPKAKRRPRPGGASPAAAADQEAPDDTATEALDPGTALAMGMEAFGQGDMQAARKLLKSIVDEHPDHTLAPYAAYKLAWCEANLGDHRAAIVEMRRVVIWLRDEGRPETAVTLREAQADLKHFRSQLDTGK